MSISVQFAPIIKQWQSPREPLGPVISVWRALPQRATQAIGPFVFLDHLGPMPSPDFYLPAHPHAGIEVISYLMSGENKHYDSAGFSGTMRAGGAQWINAGRGILHAEHIGTDPALPFHSLQIWARLPIAEENSEPSYHTYEPEDIPQAGADGYRLRLLSGDFRETWPAVLPYAGPIVLRHRSVLLHIELAPQAELEIPLPAGMELGMYGIAGATTLTTPDEVILNEGGCVLLGAGSHVRVRNLSDQVAECLLLGGTPAERPLVFYGPFVFASRERVRQAEHDFMSGNMGRLDGVPF